MTIFYQFLRVLTLGGWNNRHFNLNYQDRPDADWHCGVGFDICYRYQLYNFPDQAMVGQAQERAAIWHMTDHINTCIIPDGTGCQRPF